MKTFKLDQNGDVVIKDNKIEYVEGVEIIAQTVRQVLGTNLGEWFNDEEEGIDRYVILTKNPNYDLIQDTINTAVQQVADSLNVKLETDDFTFDLKGREITVTFLLTVDKTDSTSVEVTL
ncbi:hypothetical protein [Phascolarctobacterium sp.]|uniref:hypothetical protein n=1 Tax=Phascolarctobacterium sp. TaxID=2049039 RepID=UPI0038680AEA